MGFVPTQSFICPARLRGSLPALSFLPKHAIFHPALRNASAQFSPA